MSLALLPLLDWAILLSLAYGLIGTGAVGIGISVTLGLLASRYV